MRAGRLLPIALALGVLVVVVAVVLLLRLPPPTSSAPDPTATPPIGAPSASPSASAAADCTDSREEPLGPISRSGDLEVSVEWIAGSAGPSGEVGRMGLRFFVVRRGTEARVPLAVRVSAPRGEVVPTSYEVGPPRAGSMPVSSPITVTACTPVVLTMTTAPVVSSGSYTFTVRDVELTGGRATVTATANVACAAERGGGSVCAAAGSVPRGTAPPTGGLARADLGLIVDGPGTGFGKGLPPVVRTEHDTQPLAELAPSFFNQFNGAVSPDGRRAVYWARGASGPHRMFLWEPARFNEPFPLFDLPDEEPGAIAWAPDGSGVAYAVYDGGSSQGVRPTYWAVRVFDLAARSIDEVTKVSEARYVTPLTWRRGVAIYAATVPYSNPGTPTGSNSFNDAFMTISEAGARNIQSFQQPASIVGASTDGAYAAALLHEAGTGNTRTVAVTAWPVSAFAQKTELRLDVPTRADWRKTTQELVLVNIGGASAAIELWNAVTGARRSVASITGFANFLVRADGSGVVVEMGQRQYVLIDLATGARADLPVPPPRTQSDPYRISATVRLRP